MTKMTEKELTQFLEFYIGEDPSGALHDIEDMTQLREFYYVDCDLDIEPSNGGTVAAEFERILRSQPPQFQARVLRAGLERFFEWSRYESPTVQEKLQPRLEAVADRLESQPTVLEITSPRSTSDSVRVLLEEAANAINRGRVSRSVDRIHTALHGHIRHICDSSSIAYGKSPKIKPLFVALRDNHPAFKSSGPRAQDIEKTLNSVANIVDALGPIRNQASLSHPPEENLLNETEATLVVNAVTTVFNYIEEKVVSFSEAERQSSANSRLDEIPF